jgi:hypothetical protein
MSAKDLEKLTHEDLARHAQEGWDLAARLRAETVHLRKILEFLQEGVCRRNCFPEENVHVGDCEKATEMLVHPELLKSEPRP